MVTVRCVWPIQKTVELPWEEESGTSSVSLAFSKLIPKEQIWAGYILTMSQRLKWMTQRPKSEGPAVIYTLSFGVSNPSINLDITAVFNGTLFGTFTEMKGNLWRKKLHNANQDSNLPKSCFSNTDNIRVPILR